MGGKDRRGFVEGGGGGGAGEESEGRDFVIILIIEGAIIRSKFNN